jgi:tRNA(Ile)-lysidine synthase
MSAIDASDALRHALLRERRAPVMAAFSGGLDSTVLLHALAQDSTARDTGLRAVHIHHGLQAQADEWAAHCGAVCAALGVELLVVEAQVDRASGDGLEAAARRARYSAFEDLLREDEVLVTAHHRDDQAETFLLRALRGSGPDGLAAMRPWRSFARGQHWRPLLDTPRATLLAYAQQHRLRWREDPSNVDTAYERNFLRQRILPLLRQRWPHASDALARSASLSAEASALLHDEDALALAMAATADPCTLSVDALQTLPASRRARVLRLWVSDLGFPPLPGAGIARIESDLLPARADANARFEWRGTVIERWRDLLHVAFVRESLPPDWRVRWDGRAPLPLPGGGVLSLQGAQALPSPMHAFARQGGERIVLPGREHSHTLKHVLQELGIAPWERARLPLLADAAGELCAVGDVAYSAGFDAWLRENDARLHWEREG